MSDQGTQEWRDARAGNITASRISDVLTGPRKGQKESRTRANYRAQLICERLTGKAVQDEYQSWDMKLGIEREPYARAEYEIKTGTVVDLAGFIPHPTIPRSGCSPDGTIGSEGLVQFKCGKTATHIDWMMSKIVPVDHRPQMYFEMACTGRKWTDFVSYEPNLPPHLQLFIVRLERDEVAIAEIETEVQKLNAEIDEIIAKLNGPEDLTPILEQSLENAVKRVGL